MCMCGGIIEAGLIAALVGYIGKKIHKCNCKCHSNHLESCNHCDNENKSHSVKIEKPCLHNNKNITYKIIQYILGIISIIGIGMLTWGIYDMYKHHEHEHHNHIEHHIEHNH